MVTDEESDLDEPRVTLTEEVIGLKTEFRDCENFYDPVTSSRTPLRSPPMVLLALSRMFHSSLEPPQRSL